jgi:hypothetical protein
MTLLAASLFATALAVAPLDCVRPDTPALSAICADPSLRAAENSLRAAFNALLERTPPASRAALQLRWDKHSQHASCLQSAETREDCLRASIDAERSRLSGTALSGPGPAAPMVAEFYGRVSTGRFAGLAILTPRFADPKRPGERIVNRAVQQFVRDRAYSLPAGWPAGSDRTYGVDGAISFASPDFISIRLFLDYPNGDNPHSTGRTVAVNQKLNDGRPTTFSDLFADSAPAKIATYCKKQDDERVAKILAEMVRLGIPSTEDPTISDRDIVPIAGQLENWVFDFQGATVFGLTEATQKKLECRLTAAELRPLLASGVKIWP